MFEAVNVEIDWAVEGRQKVGNVSHRFNPRRPSSFVFHKVDSKNERKTLSLQIVGI
jgi:hypothetical protein